MQVEIYGDVKGTPLSHKIWGGELSALPRPDDMIVIDEDRGALYVRHVTLFVATDTAAIHVWMDRDEYPAVI